jgi:hypothetical protein
MTTNSTRSPYSQRSIVFFNHLHVDKVGNHSPRPDDDGNFCCEVEGKPRRMLILRDCLWLRLDTAVNTERPSGKNDCRWYGVKFRPGYLVLSLRSDFPPNGDKEHLCLGKGVIEKDKRTVVELKPICYPREIVCHRDGQQVKFLDNTRFSHIEKELMLRGLGWSPI